MDFNLAQKISELIDTKREGQYWDFKETHHDNKAELLHDILCLSNSLYKGNKYLIFGVSDPREGCEVKGVKGKNRRSQSDLIDFIRSKPFAGDIRPEIEMRTVNIQKKDLDVVIIFDSPQKPYYLKEDYRDRNKKVNANSIYTRNIDTNTPIDKSADINFIKLMWRERFGLDVQPSKRMITLLRKPSEWDKNVGNKEYAYHKFYPEYQVQFCEPREFKDVFSYFYINDRSFIGMAKFKYLSTELFQLPYMNCDEMRIELAVPENGNVYTKGREVWYMYYVLESRNGAFLHFMTDGTYNLQSRGGEAAFIMYRNNNEKKEFEEYLAANLNKLDEIPDSDFGKLKQSRIEKSGQNFVFSPIEMVKIVTLYNNWKQSKDRA